MEPADESILETKTVATTDAFLNLDMVDGDVVDLRQLHRSPVAFTDFPDMLPPSRETSGSNNNNTKKQTKEAATSNEKGPEFNSPSSPSNKVESDTSKNDKMTAKIHTSKSAATITTAASTSITNMAAMVNLQSSPNQQYHPKHIDHIAWPVHSFDRKRCS